MEMHINPYDRECLRMAILKHEQTFKEQVNELHRLYHIQKLLMNNRSIGNIRPDGNKQNEISLSHQLNYDLRKLDLEQPAEAAEELEVIDESEIELTLGPTRYNKKNRRKKSEAELTSDSGLSFSSSSTGSSHVNRTSSRSHYMRRSKEQQLGGCEDQLRQDERLKMPPWLFQVLSVNMT